MSTLSFLILLIFVLSQFFLINLTRAMVGKCFSVGTRIVNILGSSPYQVSIACSSSFLIVVKITPNITSALLKTFKWMVQFYYICTLFSSTYLVLFSPFFMTKTLCPLNSKSPFLLLLAPANHHFIFCF